MGRSASSRSRAAVVTVSDGVRSGTRRDDSGNAVAARLEEAGFEVVQRAVVPDDRGEIEQALRDLAHIAELVVTTGGTGFGPRDVTPEATRAVIDREAPGLAELMRVAGTRTTPMAALSRGVTGTLGHALVVNLPGSPRGATESVEALLPVLPHALETLAGRTEHAGGPEPEPVPDRRADGGGHVHELSEELAKRRALGEEVVVATAIRVHGSPPCVPGQKMLVGPDGPLAGTLGCAEFDSGALADAPAVLAEGRPSVRTYQHELGSVEVYLEPHRRAPTLLVLGATPVAAWLLRWASDLGYDTVLVEPRPERITDEHRAVAGTVASAPEEVSLQGDVDAVHTDHDAPDLAEHLGALVKAGARFIGVMGSSRHAGPHLDALRAMGFTDEEVARIRTPVGLDVGARTPQEIALSILAGLVASRTGRTGERLAGDAR
jgi:molybdenum cofactor synthesis domain-containing protein